METYSAGEGCIVPEANYFTATVIATGLEQRSVCLPLLGYPGGEQGRTWHGITQPAYLHQTYGQASILHVATCIDHVAYFPALLAALCNEYQRELHHHSTTAARADGANQLQWQFWGRSSSKSKTTCRWKLRNNVEGSLKKTTYLQITRYIWFGVINAQPCPR